MGRGKVIYGSEVLIDLTGDTVTAEVLRSGYTAHGKDGNPITGTNTFDVDSRDATATPDATLEGETFYAGGKKQTGTMPNKGQFIGEISTKDQVVTIPYGSHDGSGSVGISETEKAKLIPANIMKDKVILGVVGTGDSASEITAQEKTIAPKRTPQVVLPDEGYDYLSQVTVSAISFVETPNAAGGTTVTIAGE